MRRNNRKIVRRACIFVQHRTAVRVGYGKPPASADYGNPGICDETLRVEHVRLIRPHFSDNKSVRRGSPEALHRSPAEN
jgi:hypothetical protein